MPYCEKCKQPWATPPYICPHCHPFTDEELAYLESTGDEASASPRLQRRRIITELVRDAIAGSGQLSLNSELKRSYEPSVIGTFVNKLYNEAARIVFSATTTGLIIGGLLGYYLKGMLVAFNTEISQGMAVFLGVLIGASIGYSNGSNRAFTLKLHAQTLLIQAQIEMNTRALWAANEEQKREETESMNPV